MSEERWELKYSCYECDEKDAEIERLKGQIKHAFEHGFAEGWRAQDSGWVAYDAALQHYWKDFCGVKS